MEEYSEKNAPDTIPEAPSENANEIAKQELLSKLNLKYRKLRRKNFLFVIHMFFYSLFVVAFSPLVFLFNIFKPYTLKRIFYERLCLRWKYLFDIFRYARSSEKYKYLCDYNGPIDAISVDMEKKKDDLEITENFVVLYEKLYFHIIPKDLIIWAYILNYTDRYRVVGTPEIRTDESFLVMKLLDGTTYKHLFFSSRMSFGIITNSAIDSPMEDPLLHFIASLPNTLFGYTKSNKALYKKIRKEYKREKALKSRI